jgi:ribosomal-protein-serine acetyltransferase
MFYHKIDAEIELKPVEPYHAEELFSLVDRNREHLRQWLPWVDATKEPKDTRSFITLSRQQYSEGNGFAAVIFHSGKMAGVIGIHQIDTANKSTSIGYWLGAEFQGKGIITKACKALIDHIFNNLKLNRVEIRCAVKNRKSRAIPERLNFSNEGIKRQCEWLYDHYLDHVVYSMLRDEWNKYST